MEEKNFKNLKVWQKSYQLTLAIYQQTKSFPKEETFVLTSQIRRAAISVCANISEGYRKTQKDFVRYLDIAMGALEETKNYMLLAKDLNYYSEGVLAELMPVTDEIGRMIYGLKKKILSGTGTKTE
jgi:four helix bundle protein